MFLLPYLIFPFFIREAVSKKSAMILKIFVNFCKFFSARSCRKLKTLFTFTPDKIGSAEGCSKKARKKSRSFR